MEIEQSHGPTHQSPPDGSNRDPCHGVGGTACRPTTRQGDFRRRNPQFTAQTRPLRQLCEGLHRGRGPAAGDRSDVAGDAAQPEPQLGSPRGARVHRAAFGPCRDPAGLERALHRRHQPAPGRADADRAPVAPVGPRHRYLDAPGGPARPRPHGAGDSFVDLHAPGEGRLCQPELDPGAPRDTQARRLGPRGGADLRLSGRQGADVPGRDRRPGLAAQDQAWWGHHYHFHVRLNCPRGAAACEDQAPPPAGDGCADAAEWVANILNPPPPDPNAPPPKPRRELLLADLPRQCAQILSR